MSFNPFEAKVDDGDSKDQKSHGKGIKMIRSKENIMLCKQTYYGD